MKTILDFGISVSDWRRREVFTRIARMRAKGVEGLTTDEHGCTQIETEANEGNEGRKSQRNVVGYESGVRPSQSKTEPLDAVEGERAVEYKKPSEFRGDVAKCRYVPLSPRGGAKAARENHGVRD